MKANKKPSYEITNFSWILFLQLTMYASTYSRYVTRGAARSYPSLSLFLAGGRSLCLAPHCTDYISPDRRAIETEGEWPLRYLQ